MINFYFYYHKIYNIVFFNNIFCAYSSLRFFMFPRDLDKLVSLLNSMLLNIIYNIKIFHLYILYLLIYYKYERKKNIMYQIITGIQHF